ncbi:MAG: polysaccharide lyase family protein [Planctomycetota bacterium]
MRKCALVMVVMFIFSANNILVEAETVWQIGKTDRDYRDLAYPGDYNTYLQNFPKDVNFVVGKSDPIKVFSAIHPGTRHRWTGHRQHPFNIRFDLATPPEGVYELQINLTDTDSGTVSDYRVTVNGKSAQRTLERGTGFRSLMHPEAGKAASLSYIFGADHLKQGTNLIELRIVHGTFLIYDSVILRKLPADVLPEVDVTMQQTIFYVKQDGKLKQEFLISADGLLGDKQIKIDVREDDDLIATFNFNRTSLGVLSDVFHLEPTDRPRKLTVILSAGRQTLILPLKQTPTKKWRIYSAPSTHTDIGYTDVQFRVIDLHNRNTSLALQLIGDYPHYHWNLESSWAAQMWLGDMPFHRHKDLYEAARQRRLSIESSYLNMLTGLCSAEEIIRNLYYSARLHREHGIPFESHTITDAPSHVWTVPSIVAGAGVRCISFGINTTRAPLLKQNIHNKSPFWWEGPDGQRILAWFSPGYAKAYEIGLKDGPDRMRAMIEAYMGRWNQRDDYPYDAILLHGAYGDNVRIGGDIARSLTEYSKRYEYPKVIMCANNDFAEYIEKNFADKIPVVRGCGGSWWEDGAASSAAETGINRVVHQDIITAETVWAAVAANTKDKRFPQRTFDNIWDNILLFDEHTWGAHNSIREPMQDFVLRQFAVKAAYATDAADETRRLLDRGLRRLAVGIDAAKNSLLTFNPSGKPRTGPVETVIPNDAVIVDDNGPVPQQQVYVDELKNVKVVFIAKDVPAVGYRTYRIQPRSGKPANPPQRFDGKILENEFYRVEFAPTTGSIASLFDKQLNKELVDQQSPYKLGQLIYAAGGEEEKGKTQYLCPNPAKVTYHSPVDAKIVKGAHGLVYSSAKAITHMKMFRRVEMEVLLYEGQKRVDFVFRLIKDITFDKEALYIAFPIAGQNPKFRYEIGGANVRPNQDHFPGACRDWFSVQRWVTVNTDDFAVAYTPIDTPLISLCKMNAGQWLEELPITNGTIFAYSMNNYWFTNYKAGQDGKFEFRYSLTSDKSIEPAAASLFGDSVVSPMRAMPFSPKRGKATLPASKSFVQVEPDSVMISTVKRADDGNGTIVRVQETSGKDTAVSIAVGFDGISKASRCDLVERVQRPLALNNGRISLKVKANSLATVRLE